MNRYNVKISFHLWAHSEKEAIAKAKSITKKQSDKYDNNAYIDSINNHPYGSINLYPVQTNGGGS